MIQVKVTKLFEAHQELELVFHLILLYKCNSISQYRQGIRNFKVLDCWYTIRPCGPGFFRFGFFGLIKKSVFGPKNWFGSVGPHGLSIQVFAIYSRHLFRQVKVLQIKATMDVCICQCFN